MKKCNVCKQSKSLDSFYKRSESKDGRAFTCVDCARARDKEWRMKNPDKIAEYNIVNKLRIGYDLTLEQYNVILKRQKGVCAICENPCPTGRSLAVDHDHVTGMVRGLLCTNCNNGLGRFQDDKKLLTKAIKYLTVL